MPPVRSIRTRFLTACGQIVRCLLLGGLVLLTAASVRAGSVQVKNGTLMEGNVAPVQGLSERLIKQQPEHLQSYPIVMVEAGYKRYFVSKRQITNVDKAVLTRHYETFTLPQRKGSQSSRIGNVGQPIRVTEFDADGRRTVTLQTDRGALPVIQGVTELHPHSVTVHAQDYDWSQGLPTSALPPDQLSAMLQKATDLEDPEDQLALARFYLQAGLLEAANRQLQVLAQRFPELAGRAAELERELKQLRAAALLRELRKRKAAGQYELAFAAANSFPLDETFDAAIVRQVEELRNEYITGREKADRALLLLGNLEAELEDPALRAAVAMFRPTIREQLDWETLPRLDAFLTFAEDESLSPAERLALAYSGWVVGSAKAVNNLSTAVSLWQARQYVTDYLRADHSGDREAALAELKRMESVGPAGVANLLPYLPPWIDTPRSAPHEVLTLETVEKVGGWSAAKPAAPAETESRPVTYTVVLPEDYQPLRAYPLLVALHPSELNIQQTAQLWGVGHDPAGRPIAGPATGNGYIVICPEFCDAGQAQWRYTAREHQAVLAAIHDAKTRFLIDSDRVFLTGHGLGADAVFDIAMAHPSLFAAAVPISGLSQGYTKFYWQNANLLPFYIINGELDRDSRTMNANEVNRMMKAGYDVTYVEMIGRGYEFYYEELPEVFEWMGRLKRAEDPEEIDAKLLRTSEDRFYWIAATGLPRSALLSDVLNPTPKAPIQPMTLEARILPAGNLIVFSSAAAQHVLRLNDRILNFNDRVRIRSGNRQIFNDFLEADVEDLLENFREDADRQRLYPVRMML